MGTEIVINVVYERGRAIGIENLPQRGESGKAQRRCSMRRTVIVDSILASTVRWPLTLVTVVLNDELVLNICLERERLESRNDDGKS